MTLKVGDWIIVFLFGCLVFFYFRGIDLVAKGDSFEKDVFENKWILFILDFQDFSCMTCLDSFLGFYQQLPLRFKTSCAWGILVMKKTEKEENTHTRTSKSFWIAEKKLRGFIRANHIVSPFLMDTNQVFGKWAEMGSSVLLFDRVGKMVHRYNFPLTGAQFEEIFEILNR
ncbi:MAG: hypothetical protein JSV17_14835 [Candidatus Aminicenantes bacterium]|nr:MAG: hypothetical protein JSV17_14835 [Candidatus Aminicenantes bacterium]